MTIEYEEKKHSYDSMAAGLESSVGKLQQVKHKNQHIHFYNQPPTTNLQPVTNISLSFE